MTRLGDDRLFAYVEGEVTPSEREEIERALEASPPDRRRLEGMRELVARLAEPDPRLEAIDLVPRVAALRARAAAAAPPPRRRWFFPSVALAAAVAGVFLVGRAFLHPGDDGATGDLRAKAASAGAPEDRWVGLQAYHVGAGQTPRALGAELPAGHGLLFSYTNLGPAPVPYLMIFAVGAGGRVYWFHPAFTDVATDPVSIRTSGDPASGVELPELLHHDYAAGPLAIYGLFSTAPIPVSTIERRVADLVREGRWDVARPPRLAGPGTGQDVLVTRVVP